jgi:cell division protein FtsN
LNLLLIIAGAVLILAVGLVLNGRAQKSQAARQARYRAPRPALNLDRPAKAGAPDRPGHLRAAAGRPASLAAPILLGLVLVVLGLWLVAAYLLPAADPSVAEAGPAAPPPAPAQVAGLSGRLSAPESTPAATSAAAAPAGSPANALAGGARNALNQTAAVSRLSQVGLMPTQRAAAAPTAPKNTSAEAAAAAARRTPPPPARPVEAPATPPAESSNLVRAVSAPPPAAAPPRAAAPAGEDHPGILSEARGFTVHLGSFTEQANAEKYRAKLASAGEAAAVSEIIMDGRRWYRVMSGRFNTRTAADAHGRELRRRGLTDDSGSYMVKPVSGTN